MGQVNFLLLPLLVPIVIAGKSFLDHQDFKMAYEAVFSKLTIILFLVSLVLALMIQVVVVGR